MAGVASESEHGFTASKSKDKSNELAKNATLKSSKSDDGVVKATTGSKSKTKSKSPETINTPNTTKFDDTIKKAGNISKSKTKSSESNRPKPINATKSQQIATKRNKSPSSDEGKKGYPGYPVKTVKKAGASSSDEYKLKKDSANSSYKKVSDNYPKNRSKFDDGVSSHKGSQDSCSPYFYLGFLGFSILLLIFVIVGYLVVIGSELGKDTYAQNHTLSAEVQRKHVAMITDNLDCSFLEKVLAMRDIPTPVTGIGAMMCLHLTDPHSMAPDSASSLILYFQQDKNTLVKHYEAGFVKLWDKCFSFNKSETIDNSACDIRSFRRVLNTFSNFGGERIADSAFFSEGVLPLKSMYKYNYVSLFRGFSRFSDGGTPHLYPEATTVEDYNKGNTGDESLYRTFPVSKAFSELVKKHRPDLSQWMKEVFGNAAATPKITENSKVDTKKEVVRHLINHYMYTTREKTSMVEKNGTVSVKVGKVEYEITYHKGGAQTSAVISAFIVKVVADAYRKTKNKNQYEIIDGEHNLQKEALFYSYLLAAQRLTYQTLPKTKEWDSRNKKSLMSFAKKTTKKLFKLFGTVEPSTGSIQQAMEVQKSKLVTRKDADRVITLMTWKRSYGDSALTANFALPRPFKSSFMSGKNETFSPFASYSSPSEGKSAPFTSSASLLLLEVPEGREQFDQEKLRLLVSASGSIRTIEAVATVVLRYLLFEEDSGAAVFAPAAYVSLLDGSFRCEKKRFLKDKKTPFSKVTDLIEENTGIICKDVGKEFEETDRMAYAISHRDMDEYLKASVDDRGSGHNYAVGY